ncbi:thiamine pyrophosphate-binding protein, partial [Candidatus Pacearchaeota archaeon]|nr:thiamine pyrophosphate-binding protein [Candidatus Pacearchaeota archaeon]
PVLCITGQVPTSQLKGGSKSRQIGFQETDIVSLFKPITKYSKLVFRPHHIKYELEKAVYIAKSGRPGPVLLDIPDDVQRAEINPSQIPGYNPEKQEWDLSKIEEGIVETIRLLKNADKPVVILGGGIKLAGCEDKAIHLIERLGVPTALTWATRDLLPYYHPLVIESFGVYAGRAGNFAVQNSDFVLAIGTRLDTHETGNDLSTFAVGAKKVVVDIDQSELDKYEARGMKVDVLINSDVRDFFDIFNKKAVMINRNKLSSWIQKVKNWKGKYPICLPEYYNLEDKVDPYVFMDVLSRALREGDIVITDAGGNLTWTMQGFRAKKTQKLFSAFNHSPMGYSLPASIGACFATQKPVICIIGDGGIQMNIQELATIRYHNLPIKLFLFNNNGYGIIQQTQDTWLDSNYSGSNPESGVCIPDLLQIAKAYKIPTLTINNHNDLGEGIWKTLDYSGGPILCEVRLEQHQKITPKLEFGRPIEDASPLLDRNQFSEEMGVNFHDN